MIKFFPLLHCVLIALFLGCTAEPENVKNQRATKTKVTPIQPSLPGFKLEASSTSEFYNSADYRDEDKITLSDDLLEIQQYGAIEHNFNGFRTLSFTCVEGSISIWDNKKSIIWDHESNDADGICNGQRVEVEIFDHITLQAQTDNTKISDVLLIKSEWVQVKTPVVGNGPLLEQEGDFVRNLLNTDNPDAGLESTSGTRNASLLMGGDEWVGVVGNSWAIRIRNSAANSSNNTIKNGFTLLVKTNHKLTQFLYQSNKQLWNGSEWVEINRNYSQAVRVYGEYFYRVTIEANQMIGSLSMLTRSSVEEPLTAKFYKTSLDIKTQKISNFIDTMCPESYDFLCEFGNSFAQLIPFDSIYSTQETSIADIINPFSSAKIIDNNLSCIENNEPNNKKIQSSYLETAPDQDANCVMTQSNAIIQVAQGYVPPSTSTLFKKEEYEDSGIIMPYVQISLFGDNADHRDAILVNMGLSPSQFKLHDGRYFIINHEDLGSNQADFEAYSDEEKLVTLPFSSYTLVKVQDKDHLVAYISNNDSSLEGYCTSTGANCITVDWDLVKKFREDSISYTYVTTVGSINISLDNSELFHVHTLANVITDVNDLNNNGMKELLLINHVKLEIEDKTYEILTRHDTQHQSQFQSLLNAVGNDRQHALWNHGIHFKSDYDKDYLTRLEELNLQLSGKEKRRQLWAHATHALEMYAAFLAGGYLASLITPFLPELLVPVANFVSTSANYLMLGSLIRGMYQEEESWEECLNTSNNDCSFLRNKLLVDLGMAMLPIVGEAAFKEFWKENIESMRDPAACEPLISLTGLSLTCASQYLNRHMNRTQDQLIDTVEDHYQIEPGFLDTHPNLYRVKTTYEFKGDRARQETFTNFADPNNIIFTVKDISSDAGLYTSDVLTYHMHRAYVEYLQREGLNIDLEPPKKVVHSGVDNEETVDIVESYMEENNVNTSQGLTIDRNHELFGPMTETSRTNGFVTSKMIERINQYQYSDTNETLRISSIFVSFFGSSIHDVTFNLEVVQ